MNGEPIILASASPRRRDLLTMLALPFSVHTADIDETPLPEETPSELVCRLSREKAEAVARNYEQTLIIAADTVVVSEDRILGKPASPAQAQAMLKALRGRDHLVYSAVAVIYCPDGELQIRLNKTTVTMRDYTEAEVKAYIASGDPMDKAGAYAIQQPDFAPVSKISGCFASVMGLPLGCLAEMLAQYDVMLPDLAGRCAAFTGHPCCQQPVSV